MPHYIYIETYGCQMNVNDSEVVLSILKDNGYELTGDIYQADLILINTCSIRENAEQRVYGRLDVFKQVKKKNPSLVIGVIGCMAERIKEDLFKSGFVSLVVGPDSYRYLPALLHDAETGNKGINVDLSEVETYDDIVPVRIDKTGVSAFVSIMRGCNNFCAYCIVPYTRGRERSRDPKTIINEIRNLFDKGYREVTLLGQNVNSYKWIFDDGQELDFPGLIEQVALINPLLRVRFATSHPKDLSDKLLRVIATYNNICKHIHLPVQSGSTQVLQRMNRKYTREWYLGRIVKIRELIPGCAVTTDIISGFCGETEEEHQETISLMEEVRFDFAFMFKYSERLGTNASKNLKDDVPEEIKTKRLQEIIHLQNKHSAFRYGEMIGKTVEVLIEDYSKKSTKFFSGRTTQNKIVVFPALNHIIGEYTQVKIIKATQATLIGE